MNDEVKIDIVAKVTGGAAEELTKIGAATEHLDAGLTKVDESAKKADASLKRTASPVTANGLRDAATAALGVAAALTAATFAGAISDERHQQALQALGPAYQEVQRATQGTVTATEAWQLQQRLLQSGLPTTGQELAAITRAARDYARATGTETPAAIEQLSQALINGEAGGLRHFDLAVRRGATRTETFNAVLRQLQTTQRESAPIERSLAEETTHFGTTLAETGGTISTFIAQTLGIRDALTAVSHSLATTTQEFIDFDRYQESRPATATDRADRSHALNVLGQAIQRTRANLQATGNAGVSLSGAANVSGLSTAELYARVQHLETASNLLNDQGHTGNERAAVIRGGVEMLGNIPGHAPSTPPVPVAPPLPPAALGGSGGGATGPSLATRQEAALQAALVRTRAEEAAVEAAVKSRRAAEIALATQLDEAATAQKNASVARALAEHDFVDTERRDRTESLALATQRRDAELSLADAEGRGDAARRDRVGELATLRTALQGMLAETTARIEAAQAEHASASEMNALLRERIGIQQSLTQTTTQLAEVQRASTAALGSFRDAMVQQANGVADAFGAATVAALDSQQSFGAALASALRDQLKALAKMAVVEALKNTALGIGNLATFNYPGAALNFAAAAAWAGVGIAAGVGYAVTAPAKPSTPASNGGSDRAASASSSRASSEGVLPFTLTVVVNGALFNEGVEEGVVRALNGASARGILPRGMGT